MKGKKVSEESKFKRKKTNELKILNGYIKPEMSEITKQKIGYKSSLKFTDEYKQKMRSINEERGVWIPLNKKNDYRFYRDISNWVGQVISENTIGVDNLKTGKLYDKNNKDKNSYVRDHIFGRKNGFILGVFPEIIRHPANCQIIYMIASRWLACMTASQKVKLLRCAASFDPSSPGRISSQ